MKAALFTDSYLPNTDGVVSSILAYRRGLEAAGHKWAVFAPDAPGYKDAPGDEVLRFSAVKFPPYPEYRAVLFPYSISAKTAQRHKIQLVHSKAMMSMGVAAYSFARRCRLPCMASMETMVPDGVHYLSKNRQVQAFGKDIAWSYLKWLYSHYDLVTAPSRHTKARLARHGIESEVLPSPVDTLRFKPKPSGGAQVRRELGYGKADKLVLSVGRVVKEKNYDFILRAAKKVRDPRVKFLIVGKGPYLDHLKLEAARMDVARKFHFTGFILAKEKLIDYYNAADAFVFTSKFETQGLTLLEAFACGKPAAVLEGTAMEELVREGKNGHLFFEDEEDCAEKLLMCIDEKKWLAAGARRTALEHSIPRLTERLVGLYRRLLE
ncbi:MAG: glycosyltransferase [Candidatus Micrarchaeota archaeon]|nr:glycosyltransferase [Candidatus Micrarchaeota archaeon]